MQILTSQYTKLYTYKRRVFFSDLKTGQNNNTKFSLLTIPRTVEIFDVKVWQREIIRGASVYNGIISLVNDELYTISPNHSCAFGTMPLAVVSGNNIGNIFTRSSQRIVNSIYTGFTTSVVTSNATFYWGQQVVSTYATPAAAANGYRFCAGFNGFISSSTLDFRFTAGGTLSNVIPVTISIENLTTGTSCVLFNNLNIGGATFPSRNINLIGKPTSSMYVSESDVLRVKMVYGNTQGSTTASLVGFLNLQISSNPYTSQPFKVPSLQEQAIDNMVSPTTYSLLSTTLDGDNINNLTQGYFDIWLSTWKRP